MKIRELLSDASKWTKLAQARDSRLYPVKASSPRACQWCLDGAVLRCYPNTYGEQIVRLNESVIGMGASNYVAWNDASDRTFADVQALVTRLDI